MMLLVICVPLCFIKLMELEWSESEGDIKRTCSGFRKKSTGVVQFVTAQNHFLAVGEDSQLNFGTWTLFTHLTSTDADGGLPVVMPVLLCSFEGNAVGVISLRTAEAPPFEALRPPIETTVINVLMNGVDSVPRSMEKPRILENVRISLNPGSWLNFKSRAMQVNLVYCVV